jgi:Tol biopolymer transport system component
VLASCGRIGFAPSGDGATGTGDGATATKCSGAFGAPVLVDGLNTSSSYDSTFTASVDELTAYFYSDRSGNYDLYVATRPDRASTFTVTTVASLETTNTEAEPSLSSDGTLLAFMSTRPPSDANGDIWIATASGTTFGSPVRPANLASPSTDFHPFLQLSTSDFYFASDRSGVFRIYHATHVGTTFTAPTEVTELDTTADNNAAATISADGLDVWFRSDRPGGMGMYDIWSASRASTADAFGTPVPVVELNSIGTDTPTWISPDACRLYLTSDRAGSADIYVASR